MAKRRSEADRLFEKALRRKAITAPSEGLRKPTMADRTGDLLSELQKLNQGEQKRAKEDLGQGLSAWKKKMATAAKAKSSTSKSATAAVTAATAQTKAPNPSTPPASGSTSVAPGSGGSGRGGRGTAPPSAPSGSRSTGGSGGFGGGRQSSPGPNPAPSGSGGVEVIPGTPRQPPHTFKTANGKFCATDRWFNEVGLAFNTGYPEGAPGSLQNPWLYIAGRSFRCYYPASSVSDYQGIMTSGSSGSWLQSWGQKSTYVTF